MNAKTNTNTTKTINQYAAKTYMTVTEAVTETVMVAASCVTHTPAIVRKHKAKVSAEMDDIFAALLNK